MADDTIAAGAGAPAGDTGAVDTSKAAPAPAAVAAPVAAPAASAAADLAKASEAAAAAPAAVDKGKEPATVDDDGPWGKDWRDKLAKGDAKKLAMLGRFASPEALLAAQEEAQRKISEGLKPKGKPGDKATAEDWAAYRKENGIPDAVEDYVKSIQLPDKREIGEEDKPVVEAFAARALARGVAPADMAHMVDEYYSIQEAQIVAQEDADAAFKRESMKALRDEYGGDFDVNVNAMRPYFDGFDADLFGKLMSGRMADGTKIGNDPNIVRFFVNKALSENPMATVVPSGGGNMETLNSEIAAMDKRMREDRVGWGRDSAAQERYRKLITARDKLKA
jgi:hypothetical protein